jgi:hypothetical protein
MDFLVVLASSRLTGLLSAVPVPIEQPPVVDAAYAAIFQPPIAQVRTTMRTVKPNQASTPIVVSIQNEVLS